MASVHGQGNSGESEGTIVLDVLDASFDPSPNAVAAYSRGSDQLRCSPDIRAGDLLAAISDGRRVDREQIVLGAGSSEPIYRVLPRLLGNGPILVTDPNYSEYPYLARLLGLRSQSYRLREDNGWQIDLSEFIF